MDLNKRLDIIIQGVELAQSGGVLTLDEASLAKTTIDNIKVGNDIKKNISILTDVIIMAQKKGVYALQDSYFLYLALNGIENAIDNVQPVPIIETPVAEVPPVEKAPQKESKTKKEKSEN